VDVLRVSLQPRSVQQDVLAALLHRALGRGRVVALKEALGTEERTHVIIIM